MGGYFLPPNRVATKISRARILFLIQDFWRLSFPNLVLKICASKSFGSALSTMPLVGHFDDTQFFQFDFVPVFWGSSFQIFDLKFCRSKLCGLLLSKMPLVDHFDDTHFPQFFFVPGFWGSSFQVFDLMFGPSKVLRVFPV